MYQFQILLWRWASITWLVASQVWQDSALQNGLAKGFAPLQMLREDSEDYAWR